MLQRSVKKCYDSVKIYGSITDFSGNKGKELAALSIC